MALFQQLHISTLNNIFIHKIIKTTLLGYKILFETIFIFKKSKDLK